jgi:hypothetical protein
MSVGAAKRRLFLASVQAASPRTIQAGQHAGEDQPMNQSVFLEIEFVLLVLFSLVSPVGIYAYLMWKRAISRYTVLLFGLVLMTLSGVDVYLLQQLKTLAQSSLSSIDDVFFVSELSIALYLLPALFAGVGINMISHVLITHLVYAEQRFDREHPNPNP